MTDDLRHGDYERIKGGIRYHSRNDVWEYKSKEARKYLKKNGFNDEAVRQLPVGTIFTKNGVRVTAKQRKARQQNIKKAQAANRKKKR